MNSYEHREIRSVEHVKDGQARPRQFDPALPEYSPIEWKKTGQPMGRSMAGLSPLSLVGIDGEPDRPSVLVVGGEYSGVTLAVHLSEDHEVTFVSRTQEAAERAVREGVEGHHVESIDTRTLRNEGIDRDSVVVAASGEDSINLLVAQLARTTFDVEHVIARVNNPDRVDLFRDLGVEPICLSTTVFEEVSGRLETAVDGLPED